MNSVTSSLNSELVLPSSSRHPTNLKQLTIGPQVAYAALFLASDEASLANGACPSIDGCNAVTKAVIHGKDRYVSKDYGRL